MVLDKENCNTKMLDCLLKQKCEKRKADTMIVDYCLQLHDHNASGFDTWIKLNNLPCERRRVEMIENGKSRLSLKLSDKYVCGVNKKQITQYLFYGCGMTH